jgi:hypothetical protein
MSKSQNKHNDQKKITRKEAMKRMGKYAALTATGTFLILSPKKAQASSIETPGDGFRLLDD